MFSEHRLVGKVQWTPSSVPSASPQVEGKEWRQQLDDVEKKLSEVRRRMEELLFGDEYGSNTYETTPELDELQEEETEHLRHRDQLLSRLEQIGILDGPPPGMEMLN